MREEDKRTAAANQGGAGCEVEPAGESCEGANLGVVDAAETVSLHHAVPDSPEKNDQHKALQIPQGETDANDEEKDRGNDEAPAKSFEEGPIAVGAHHARQVVAHSPEGGHEKVNVLRAPAHLRERKQWDQECRGADVKKQIAPAIEDPQVFLEAGVGTAGTVCGREKALTSCIGDGG
jgi:hypothetical protein